MKEFFKKPFVRKILHWVLDGLMFVVPILEITELIAVIPYQYLPWYMLGSVVLRRLMRVLENYLDRDSDKPVS